MSVFHPKPIYWDAACWLGVPLPRGWLSLMGTVGCQAEPGCIWNRASFSS